MDFLKGLEKSYELFDQNCFEQMTLFLWGVVIFLPLIYFCRFLVQQMHQQESSI